VIRQHWQTFKKHIPKKDWEDFLRTCAQIDPKEDACSASTRMNLRKVVFRILEPVRIRLNDYGRIVEYTWFDLSNHVDNIKLHEFIVMPKHVHGIIEIVGLKRAGLEPAPTDPMYVFYDDSNPIHALKTKLLAEVVRKLNTFSAIRINQL
jgi:hypothetical protein